MQDHFSQLRCLFRGYIDINLIDTFYHSVMDYWIGYGWNYFRSWKITCMGYLRAVNLTRKFRMTQLESSMMCICR